MFFRILMLVMGLYFINPVFAKGWVDSNSTYDRYIGWACILGSSEVVGIHIYVDGVYVGGGNAGLLREYAVRDACGSPDSNHGFDIPVSVPESLRDGTYRSVYVHSIHANGTVALLNNAPVSIKFDALPNREKPKNIGDIVGRDMTYDGVMSPLNYFVHIGVWDGNYVIEAVGMIAASDTLKVTPWERFSTSSNGWPTYSPVVENFSQYYCRDVFCNVNDAGGYQLPATEHVGGLKEIIAKRAYMYYLIGASYTRTAFFTAAVQGTKRYSTAHCSPFGGTACAPKLIETKPIRGIYRCETFVMHVFASTSMGSGYATTNQRLYGNAATNSARWDSHISTLMNFTSRAPVFVFSALLHW